LAPRGRWFHGAARFEDHDMRMFKRVKGLILSPDAEWAAIEAAPASVAALYRDYILILAALPPFASFLGAYFFGVSHGTAGLVHPTFVGGLLRAIVQYGLSLPMIFVVAFITSSIAPYFEGKANDARALELIAYSCTPAWLATLFGLIPGLRFLDILGFYGLYLFYLGLPRMTKCPRDHADVFALAVIVVMIATGALHGWIVHLIAPWGEIAR
jgi:hypothetical protein